MRTCGFASEPGSAEIVDPPVLEPRETRQVGYDKGFYLRYSNTRAQSFELKMNARIQLRHVAFSRDDDSWTDQAGITREIRNRSYFDNERTRLIFGPCLVPEIKYFVQLDGDTDDGHTVDFFDFWWGYQFSEAAKSSSASARCPRSAIGCCRPSTRGWSIVLWRPTSFARTGPWGCGWWGSRQNGCTTS